MSAGGRKRLGHQLVVFVPAAADNQPASEKMVPYPQGIVCLELRLSAHHSITIRDSPRSSAAGKGHHFHAVAGVEGPLRKPLAGNELLSRFYRELSGLSVSKARTRIVEQLQSTGDLMGEPRTITHAVKFYEKGDRPLEIITSRQWFFKTVALREALLARERHYPMDQCFRVLEVTGLAGTKSGGTNEHTFA